jgi:hypothetical protein
MKVTLPFQVVLVVRGAGSQTPLSVLPHEIEILRAMHGEENIVLTDDKPPVKDSTFDTEEEFVRLQERFRGDNENPNPTRNVFRNLDEFEAAFASIGGGDKEALLEEAKALGINATKTWGVAKLQDAIAAAKGE